MGLFNRVKDAAVNYCKWQDIGYKEAHKCGEKLANNQYKDSLEFVADVAHNVNKKLDEAGITQEKLKDARNFGRALGAACITGLACIIID